MNERIFSKVKAYIDKYKMLSPGDAVVLGVSGGADSVCLLLMLHEISKEIPVKLLVVHVNHGIRTEGAEDAAYVEKLCKERNLPFFLVEKNIKEYARREKLSEEEAGRKVRYEAFNRILKENSENLPYKNVCGGDADSKKTKNTDIKSTDGKSTDGRIAVAHNAGDRIETMLFHLFRGTGLAGASGIKPVRDNIIRPLLCLSRAEIEEYLNKKRIHFCIDRTNLEDTYTRNRIRNHLIPFAEQEICQKAASHMWDAADMFLETEDYIRNQAKKAYAGCLEEQSKDEEKKVVIRTEILAAEEPFIQKYVLLMCLEELTEARKDITSAHIEAIRGLLTKTGCKELSLPYGLKAVKEYGRLEIRALRSEKKGVIIIKEKEPVSIRIPGNIYVEGLGEVDFSLIPYEKSQIIPEKSYTKWFDYDKITRSLVLRTRKTGDYLTINEALSKKTLKDYMIGEKIPKNQREDIYVLAEDSHILWVPGYRISQYYKITNDTKNILQVQVRGGH